MTILLALAVLSVLAGNAPAAAPEPFLRKDARNVIWCLGDSITVGAAHAGNPADPATGRRLAQASYRYWLQKLMREAGYEYDFVGRFERGSSDAAFKYADAWFDTACDGWSGKSATGPAGVLEMLTARDGKPAIIRVPKDTQIVLIHLGSNDLNNRSPALTPSAEAARDAIGLIIDGIRDQKPDVKIVVAQIIPWGGGAKNRAFNALLPELAERKRTAGSPVIVVDQFTGFSAIGSDADTYDGIHPNDAGEQKMARRWFDALTSQTTAPSSVGQ